jgi:hypothetical protein
MKTKTNQLQKSTSMKPDQKMIKAVIYAHSIINTALEYDASGQQINFRTIAGHVSEILGKELKKIESKGQIITYGILKKVNADTIFHHERNIYNASGKHIIPKWFNKNCHNYILFEVTVKPDHTEYYSNAWGSSDIGYITRKLERFSSWYNYPASKAKLFSGKEIELP